MTKLVYVDSKLRDQTLYPSGNAYVLHLTDPVKNVSRVDLVSAHIPNSFYNILNGSNVMSYHSSGYEQKNFNLNPGFYSASSLQHEMNTRVLDDQQSNVAWVPGEGKFYFYSLIPFTITVNSVELSNCIGLPVGTYHSTGTFLDQTYVHNIYDGFFIKSVNVVDFSINEFVFLDIEEFRTPTSLQALPLAKDGSGTYQGSSARNSFAIIPMTVSSGCIKHFNENGDYRVSIEFPQPIDKVSRVTVRWTNESGNLVNYQGHETNSFLLRFHTRNPRPVEALPPPPQTDLMELKRAIEAMPLLNTSQDEPKRPIIGKWSFWMFIVLFIIGYFTYKTFIKPNPPLTPA